MNKKGLIVTLLVSVLILSLVGSVYAGLWDRLLGRSCASNQVLVNGRCVRLETGPILPSKKTTLPPTCSISQGVASLGTRRVNGLFENGETAFLDIGDSLNDNDNFGKVLTDTELVFLGDSSMSLAMHGISDDYDYHEEIRFFGDNKVSQKITVETGLTYATNRHEDWKDNVFLAMPERSIGYYYVFDENLVDGNRISNSTTLEPFQIDFLGETISIENTVKTDTGAVTTNDPDTITLTVGKKAILNAGESLSVTLAGQNYLVTLLRVNSAYSVDIKVKGPLGMFRKRVSGDTTVLFDTVGPRPVQVRVEDVFDEDGVVNDRATVIVGTEQSGGTTGAYDVRKTYNHNDAYIGEDGYNPIWRWHLGASTVTAPGSLTLAKPILGVRLGMGIDHFEEVENPLVRHTPYAGDYICLPNYYGCMIFERMNQGDDDFRWYEFLDVSRDLRSVNNQAVPDQKNIGTIKIRAVGVDDQGFVEGVYGSNFESDTLYVALNRSMVGVWREEQDGSDLLPVVLNNSRNSNGIRTLKSFSRLDYGSTLLNLHLVCYNGVECSLIVDDPVNVTDITRASRFLTHTMIGTSPLFQGILNDGDLAIYLKNSTQNGFTYLGHSEGDTVVANDVLYKDGNSLVDISNWEENTRTRAGIIISDPDVDIPRDRLRFAIPSDIAKYKAVVTFAKPRTGVLDTCI